MEKNTIKVGVVPTADAAPLFIALRKGYFTHEGLIVEPQFIVGGAQAVPSLLSDRLDIGQTDYISTFTAVSHGLPLKVVGAMSQAGPGTFGLMAGKNSGIESLKDLKGKKVAVNILNGLATLTVTAMLEDAGMKASDVKFAEVPFPEMVRKLIDRQVDAAWLAEPFLTDGGSRGLLRPVPDTMAGRITDLPVGGWMAADEWREKNPQTLAAFQRAIAKAQQVAAGSRKEVEAVLPTYMKIDAKTAAQTSLGAYPTALDLQRLQRVADLMQQHRYVNRPLDVKSLVATGS
ncbi:ABC transporter substrate-binding protein [Nonomuraea basaltis]|nr:ABC transporter substrate-binding protein [Nonomuraea basaltis]